MKLYYYSSMLFLRTSFMFAFVLLMQSFYGSYADELFCEQTNCKFYGNHHWSDKPCFKNKFKTVNLNKTNHRSKKKLIIWNDNFNFTSCPIEYCSDSSSNSSYSLNLKNKLLSIKTYGKYGGEYGDYSMEQQFLCKELPKEKVLMYSKKDLKTSVDGIKSDVTSKVDLAHFNEIREITIQIDLKLYSTLVALHFTPSWKKDLIQFQGKIILFDEICNLYGSYKKKLKKGKIDIRCRLSNYNIFTKIDIYNLVLISGKGKDSSKSFVKLFLKLENSKNLNQNDFLMAIQSKKNFYNSNKFSNQISIEKERAQRLKEERKRKALEQRIAELEKKNKQLQQPKEIKQKPSNEIGSGFYVSKFRHIVTNQHVVNKCKKITVGDSMSTQIRADLIASDKRNDLAILQTVSMEMASADTKSFVRKLAIEIVPVLSGGLMRSEDVVGGEEIFVAGFPLANQISDSLKLSDGIVSSTKGYENDVSKFEITSVVRKGNSGGPIYDKKGNIVGVVVEQVNVSSSDNVNFAIKGSTVKQFLSAHNVPTKWSNRQDNIDTKDIYKIASKQTVMIVCYRG